MLEKVVWFINWGLCIIDNVIIKLNFRRWEGFGWEDEEEGVFR